LSCHNVSQLWHLVRIIVFPDEVGPSLCRFWSMLGYLANTLIFVLVGVVISQRAFSGVQGTDWIFMAVLYFGIVVIR